MKKDLYRKILNKISSLGISDRQTKIVPFVDQTHELGQSIRPQVPARSRSVS